MNNRNVVAVQKVENIYSNEEISTAVKKAIEAVGGITSVVNKGNKVVLKPNLFIARKWTTGTTTNPQIVEEIIKLVLRANAEPIIAEGPGVGRDALYVFKTLGYTDLAQEYGLEIIDLNKAESVMVDVPEAVVFRQIKIPKLVFETDVIINIPKMKTHNQATVTLGMKNLKGFLVGDEKRRSHTLGLHQSIADLNKVIKPDLTVVDALVAMEGNGPSYGDEVELGAMVVGKDVVAVDSVCCKMMEIDPSSVGHIRLAYEQGMKPEEIRCVGDWLSKKFKTPQIRPPSLRRKIYRLMLRPFYKEVVNIDKNKCIGCGECVKVCEEKAIDVDKEIIDRSKCTKCEICIEFCPVNAIQLHEIFH